MGSSDWSHPSREGLAAAANSHLVRRLRLARPGPRGGLLLLLHGCHRRRPALTLTSSRALQTRGPSLGSGRMSQEPGALRIGRGKAAATGWGEGSDGEGKTSGTRLAPPCKIPPSATADPRTPHSPRPPPPQRVESLGDQTRPSGKLVEQREAPDRARATSHRAGGARLAFYCSPRPPPAPGGSPRLAQRARWNGRAPRSSISRATATRERALRVARAPCTRGQGCRAPRALSPPPPRGLLLKPGEAERARAKPSVALSLPLGMLQRSEKAGGRWGLGTRSPIRVANTCRDPRGGPRLWPEALHLPIWGNGHSYP